MDYKKLCLHSTVRLASSPRNRRLLKQQHTAVVSHGIWAIRQKQMLRENTITVWHADPLLGNDSEISSYTIAVAK
jgi:hypothetical protein